MILYLDSSSLAKIYLEEESSELVRAWVDAAEAVATSRVALPEVLSALVRRREQGELEPGAFQLLYESLEADWPGLVILPVRERSAGDLVVKHALRGFDAVHLAAAVELRELLQSDDVVFSAFDSRLLRAARAEGISCLLPAS